MRAKNATTKVSSSAGRKVSHMLVLLKAGAFHGAFPSAHGQLQLQRPKRAKAKAAPAGAQPPEQWTRAQWCTQQHLARRRVKWQLGPDAPLEYKAGRLGKLRSGFLDLKGHVCSTLASPNLWLQSRRRLPGNCSVSST